MGFQVLLDGFEKLTEEGLKEALKCANEDLIEVFVELQWYREHDGLNEVIRCRFDDSLVLELADYHVQLNMLPTKYEFSYDLKGLNSLYSWLTSHPDKFYNISYLIEAAYPDL